MTRRQFGKAAAAAASAVAFAAGRAGAWEPNGDTLKVGLLGCGGRGTGAAVNMLEGGNNVQLVAMADLFQDRLDGSRNQLGNHGNPEVRARYAVEDGMCFTGLDAYRQLLATDVDIILEGTLPYCRPDHIAAAIEAGKHLFSEKPVAVDPPGVRKVIAAAEQAEAKGLSFVAGTQRRHQKRYIETIAKIHDGAIGDVVALRAYWCGSLPFVRERQPGWSDLEYRIRNWINYCWVCGDNIVEQHVHNLDVCNWVMQAHPVSVFASGGRSWKPRTEAYGDLYDNFSCDYEYPGGVHMMSMSRHWNGARGAVFEEAAGTKGRSSCADMGEDIISPLVQEHIDLVNSITGAGPYYNEGVNVAESTLTAIMGRMSAYTGELVTWDNALESDLRLVPEKLDFDLEYPVGQVPVPVNL